MNDKCRPDEYPPYPKGPLARRIAAAQPKPPEPKWTPAWLKHLTPKELAR